MISKDEVDPYAFSNLQDVDQRLRRSICRHIPTGKWVNIESVGNTEPQGSYTFIGTTYLGEIVSGNIRELDYSCPKMGMFSVDDCVYLAERTPVRQYKGGINPQSVKFRFMTGEEGTCGFYHNAAFYDMLDDKYPNITDLISNAMKSPTTKNYAVRRFNWIKINEFKIVTLYFMRDKVISFTNKGVDITPSNVNHCTVEFNRKYLIKEIDLIRSVLQ